MIFLFGSSGFVGTSFRRYFKNEDIRVYSRGEEFNLDATKIVINFAAKAHDLKNSSSIDDYYKVNRDLTIKIFDAFLASNAKVFITLSSVKAVADKLDGELKEEHIPNPITHYGKSKLLAEQYILSKEVPHGKRVYILRPCMIHGPGNKGNLNLLYKIVTKGLPWPLGAFQNQRSFCTIDNLLFIIKEIIEREDIQSGIYNVADDVPLSTNEVIALIAQSRGKNIKILRLSKSFITALAKVGDFLRLPLNSERLQKLTESYVVSNDKIKAALNQPLPIASKDGLLRTFQSFSYNV